MFWRLFGYTKLRLKSLGKSKNAFNEHSIKYLICYYVFKKFSSCIQARSQAYSHTPGSTSILKNENFKWPKNGVKLES